MALPTLTPQRTLRAVARSIVPSGLFAPGTNDSGSPFSCETMFFASDPAHWGQSPARKESAVQARRTRQANTAAARYMQRRYQPNPKLATHFACRDTAGAESARKWLLRPERWRPRQLRSWERQSRAVPDRQAYGLSRRGRQRSGTL